MSAARTDAQNLLSIRNLRCAFELEDHRKLEAIRGIDLAVRDREIFGIVGESGSGKSVTMKTVARMLPANARVACDEMIFDGRDMTALSERDMRAIRGRDIAIIFQDPMTSLDPLRRVDQHIREVLRRHRGLDGAQAKAETLELLRLVGIPSPRERMRQYPHELSGGLRQRVLIAMALACQPKLLIADEPTTALDTTIQAQILDLIKSLQQRIEMSVVLITHDFGVVANLCHRVAVMYGGMMMELGTVDDLFERPLHPYTRALLRSIPSIDETDDHHTRRLTPIQGQPPSIWELPPGCPFAARCADARAACLSRVPDIRESLPGHFVRCALADAAEAGR
jgi:oligopeptide/dipeptide ABC transporter ATP-binding protein